MAVSLAKGGNDSVTTVAVGLGWDVRSATGAGFDLDASSLMAFYDGPHRGQFFGEAIRATRRGRPAGRQTTASASERSLRQSL